MDVPVELDELRVNLEQIRGLLESLVVRGLRACGTDELAKLSGVAGQLSEFGAAHLAKSLTTLHDTIERHDAASAAALLQSLTNVRLVERLLTLRVARWRYAAVANSAAESEVDEEDAA